MCRSSRAALAAKPPKARAIADAFAHGITACSASSRAGLRRPTDSRASRISAAATCRSSGSSDAGWSCSTGSSGPSRTLRSTPSVRRCWACSRRLAAESAPPPSKARWISGSAEAISRKTVTPRSRAALARLRGRTVGVRSTTRRPRSSSHGIATAAQRASSRACSRSTTVVACSPSASRSPKSDASASSTCSPGAGSPGARPTTTPRPPQVSNACRTLSAPGAAGDGRTALMFSTRQKLSSSATNRNPCSPSGIGA